MIPIKSSLLTSVKYDETNKTLHVQFKDGTISKYKDVHKDTLLKMLSSPSVGKFFKEHIHKKHKKL